MRVFLCEKPDQAKAIAAGLGLIAHRKDGFYQNNGIAVTWCFGHMLSQSYPQAYGEEFEDFGNIDALPVIPTQWKHEIADKVVKQFKVIESLLSKANEVVIATDADREGELIGREILDFCRYRGKVLRFWTSGLDTVSVKKALGNLIDGKKKYPLYLAGLARQRADWLVGMNLSRAYTVAYASGRGKEHTLSVGRIQTPTLNLVVQRDRAIEAFVAYPYCTLDVAFQAKEGVFQAAWQIPDELKNQDGLCVEFESIRKLCELLKQKQGEVVLAKTDRKSMPSPLPFSLSELQQQAGKQLGLSAAKVLSIAQSLYEKHKIISYPRTPCSYLPLSQKAEVEDVIAALCALDPGLESLCPQLDLQRSHRVFNDVQVNKHSHHAMIPTMRSDFDLSALNSAERSIYLMIRNRYLALFLSDYVYDASVIEVQCAGHLFKAMGQVPIDEGWKAFLKESIAEEKQGRKALSKDDVKTLPAVKMGEMLGVQEVHMHEKKTTPPARFTEPTLLAEMKSLTEFLKTVDDEQVKKVLKHTEGLGTEATRASVIERLFEMNYLVKQKGKIVASDKGKNLIARIPQMVADPVTTAKWEIALSAIEQGKLSLDEFMAYQSELIRKLVQQAKEDFQSQKQ